MNVDVFPRPKFSPNPHERDEIIRNVRTPRRREGITASRRSPSLCLEGIEPPIDWIEASRLYRSATGTSHEVSLHQGLTALHKYTHNTITLNNTPSKKGGSAISARSSMWWQEEITS